jgi:hypothetical protein
MPKHEVGRRVGAILCGDDKSVKFLGYGVYQGDLVPGPDSKGTAFMMHEMGLPNPNIKLDNGDIVYGCECWWGSEAVIREKIETSKANGLEIIEVRMVDHRPER